MPSTGAPPTSTCGTIARVLLSRAHVLVLGEPTNHGARQIDVRRWHPNATMNDGGFA